MTTPEVFQELLKYAVEGIVITIRQAWIHTSFHRFTEIVQILNNRYIFDE